MIRRPLLTLLGAMTIAGASDTLAQDPAEIIGRAGRVYRNLSSLQADFVQVVQDRAQGDTLTSRGTVIQAGNNLFAMRFSDPAGEAVVVDGTYVWTYTPSTAPNQVLRSRLPTDPVYGVNLLATLLDRPRERYHTTYVRADTVDGRAADVVDLVPNSGDVPFRRARVWISSADALPRRVELDEAPGLRRILMLSRLQPNAPYTRKTFTFDVPSGVRVVREGS